MLVFNSGSSSLKHRLYAEDPDGSLRLIASGMVNAFGDQAKFTWLANGQRRETRVAIHNHREATARVLRWLRDLTPDAAGRAVTAIGHRVVHGGEIFREPVLLTPETIARIESLSALAPIHNPIALEVIRACRLELEDTLPMVAVFDTAFHALLPQPARTYALPQEWTRAHGIRRYGFHGIAHRYMYERCLALHGEPASEPRVITFQLGNGCSVAAIRAGRSVETSMGYTPLEGLIMSTRSGDVDPGVLVQLMAAGGLSATALARGLNHESGLKGLSGVTSDMRELLRLEAEGHAGARLAIDAFCHRARKYLGAYAAVLGGADAVVFGGGIGEHAALIRARICAGMEWCGLRLDAAANAAAVGTEGRISAPRSAPAVYVIPVNEELLIARDARQLLASRGAG